MFKNAVAKCLLVSLIVLTIAACTSCVTNSYLFGEGNIFRSQRRTFIKIKTLRRVLIAKTSSDTPQSVIAEFDIELASTASGVILKHYRDMSLIATSAHVCSIKHGSQLNMFIPDYDKNDPTWHLLEKNYFSLYDLNGKHRTGTILSIDYISDLCILVTKKVQMPSAKISLMDPIVGEKYYNIAAPHGIWGKKAVPLLEGRFVGKTSSPFTGGSTYMFTIPAAGGSSGSPIFNWYGEIVGLVHSAYRNFNNVSMAATNDQLTVLLSNSMMKLRKHYSAYAVILSINN